MQDLVSQGNCECLFTGYYGITNQSESHGGITRDSLGDVTWSQSLMTSKEVRDLPGKPDGNGLRKQHHKGRKRTVMSCHVSDDRPGGSTVVISNK